MSPGTVLAGKYRLVSMLDQEDEQIEIARNQANLTVATQQQSLARRQRELTEPIARQRVILARVASDQADGLPREPRDHSVGLSVHHGRRR